MPETMPPPEPRPNLDEIINRAREKHTREMASATARKAKAKAYDVLGDQDFADAGDGQRAELQAGHAATAFQIADGIPGVPELAPIREAAEALGRSLATQATSLSQASDQLDPG